MEQEGDFVRMNASNMVQGRDILLGAQGDAAKWETPIASPELADDGLQMVRVGTRVVAFRSVLRSEDAKGDGAVFNELIGDTVLSGAKVNGRYQVEAVRRIRTNFSVVFDKGF